MTDTKKVLITGVTGQMGSILADKMVARGHEVYGMVRRTSTPRYDNISHLYGQIEVVHGDITDPFSLDQVMEHVRPDIVFNMAAQSNVWVSFKEPMHTSIVTGVGVTNILEAIRKKCPEARFLQSGSSEQFGKVRETPQTESTPFYPRSPYGAAKVYAHYMTVNYREAYGLFATNSIAFNFESFRRSPEALSMKVARHVAMISYGLTDHVVLGDLEPKRDWNWAEDIADGMILAVEHDRPGDFVFASGKSYSVRDFVKKAFSVAGISNWEDFVKQDASLFRPSEVDHLVGNAAKARRVLGWRPKIKFHKLVELMVEHEMEKIGSMSDVELRRLEIVKNK